MKNRKKKNKKKRQWEKWEVIPKHLSRKELPNSTINQINIC